MQTLAWGTIVALILLLPGFCFFPGLYAPERFSRDLTPRNPLGSLASIVLVALLTHASLTLIYRGSGHPVLWDRVLEALLLAPSPKTGDVSTAVTTPRILAGYYESAPVRIPGYIFLSCFSAWFFGLCIGNLAVRGYFPFLSQHPWAAAIPRGDATYAFILSDVESEQRVLLYKGRLLHFGLNADGGFSYVMLTGTEQGYMKLDGEAPKAGEFKEIGRRARMEPNPGSPSGRLSTVTGRLAKLIRGVLSFFGLGRMKLDIESGAVLSIAASNVRDIVIQTFPKPSGTTAASGEMVRFQQILKELDYFEGEIDGLSSSRMDAALKRFQDAFGVREETGLGSQTREMLESLSEDTKPVHETPPDS